MKLIDEKGKLFGTINIIDFLVILFLLFSIPMFFLGYKIFTKKTPFPVSVKSYLDLDFSFKIIKLKPEILKLIKVGDREIDANGNLIGEITRIGQSRPYMHVVNLGKAETLTLEDKVLKELLVKMKIKAIVKTENLYYKEKVIAIDSSFVFNTSKYEVEVIPVIQYDEKWLRLRVRFLGTPPEVFRLVQSGHTEKDGEGRVIARLIEIVSTTPTPVSALKLEENKFVFINDPYRSDIVVSLDALCTEKDGSLYFKDQPVKIGNHLTFISDLYVVSGMIIGIEER